MAEYIDRETLLKAVEKMDRLDKESTPYEYDKQGYILLIENAPTADVAEVKHGEWTKVGRYYQHKGCPVSPTELFYCPYEYCPRCGAKMNGRNGA